MPKPPHRHKHHSAALASFIDVGRLDDALVPWIPDADDRSFVLRCVLLEGPLHHCGSNFVLLSMLSELLRRLGVQHPAPGKVRPFKMRLPPHLEEEELDERQWPMGIPESALSHLRPGDSRAQEAMVECLTDGPPQHAVANVLMVQLLEALLHHVRESP